MPSEEQFGGKSGKKGPPLLGVRESGWRSGLVCSSTPVGLTNLEQVLSQSHPDSICLDNLNPRTPSCIGMSLWPPALVEKSWLVCLGSCLG